jgi:hypothetical protein
MLPKVVVGIRSAKKWLNYTGTHEIKRVGPGESLTSLLSFIDMLTGIQIKCSGDKMYRDISLVDKRYGTGRNEMNITYW